jgi:hypothetical protein
MLSVVLRLLHVCTSIIDGKLVLSLGLCRRMFFCHERNRDVVGCSDGGVMYQQLEP